MYVCTDVYVFFFLSRVGDYKLIVGSPGRYNGWYLPRTKPACRKRRKGYQYQMEDRLTRRDALKDERASKSGWWFSSSVGYLRNSVIRAAEMIGAYKAYTALNGWYTKYRCDKFNYAHKMEEMRFKQSHIQLYNLKGNGFFS